jgi:hypothetical protein
MGVGLASAVIIAAGLVVLAVAFARGSITGAESLQLGGVVLLGLTASLFMLVRAAHDPMINQGNPETLQAFVDVVARRQYPLPGLWPRRSPLWIQLFNLVQYADWQVASGLDQGVAASWWRTPWSFLALVFAVAGWRWHRRLNPRGALGATVLLLTASLGIVAVLNLRAGPSILETVLPAGATYEPRERDYFFALAFAMAGAWAGAGAVVFARRWVIPVAPRLIGPAALVMAALPVLLNWRAAPRRRLPERALAPTFGEALLASVPDDGVLVVAGDNDSYTVWHRQAVLGQRTDVTPVTISLLAAEWYRAELARRRRLIDAAAVGTWSGDESVLREIVIAAKRDGRPVAFALSVAPDLRRRLAPAWTMHGLVYVAEFDVPARADRIDRVATAQIAELVARRIPVDSRGGSGSGAAWVGQLLACPSQALTLGQPDDEARAAGLLDSRCNLK